MKRFESILTSSVAELFQALPSLAASLGAKSTSQPADAGERSLVESKMRINDSDIEYMNAFPATNKAWVLDRIMSLTPLQKSVLTENHHYEKMLMKLHDDGFSLLDLQRQDTAFTTVWYCKSRNPLQRSRADVTMLLWELLEDGEATSTTVMVWRV